MIYFAENDVLDMLSARPKLLERKPIAERITVKVAGFVETFMRGGGSAVARITADAYTSLTVAVPVEVFIATCAV